MRIGSVRSWWRLTPTWGNLNIYVSISWGPIWVGVATKTTRKIKSPTQETVIILTYLIPANVNFNISCISPLWTNIDWGWKKNNKWNSRLQKPLFWYIFYVSSGSFQVLPHCGFSWVGGRQKVTSKMNLSRQEITKTDFYTHFYVFLCHCHDL